MAEAERVEETPEHLRRTVTVGGVRVTLLGTAHVSPSSVEDVRREVTSGRYDAVAVELCDSRYRALIEPEALERMNLFQVIRDGKAGMVAASLALGAYQQRLAEQFDIRPGAELRAAVDGAADNGLKLHLVDRDIGITLKRVYRAVPWWQRFAILGGLGASVFSSSDIRGGDRAAQGRRHPGVHLRGVRRALGLALRAADHRTGPLHGGAFAPDRRRRAP